MPVPVPSFLFTLKKAECLFGEQELNGGMGWGWWEQQASKSKLPGRHIGNVWSTLLYSKLGFILDVEKCFQIFVASEKEHLWSQAHVGVIR